MKKHVVKLVDEPDWKARRVKSYESFTGATSLLILFLGSFPKFEFR
jgi:hypothetical protein